MFTYKEVMASRKEGFTDIYLSDVCKAFTCAKLTADRHGPWMKIFDFDDWLILLLQSLASEIPIADTYWDKLVSQSDFFCIGRTFSLPPSLMCC